MGGEEDEETPDAGTEAPRLRLEEVEQKMVLRRTGPLRSVLSPSWWPNFESDSSMIGPITLGTNRTGERSAGNPHAAFDEAGAGNGSDKATAPAPDPTDERGEETELRQEVRHRQMPKDAGHCARPRLYPILVPVQNAVLRWLELEVMRDFFDESSLIFQVADFDPGSQPPAYESGDSSPSTTTSCGCSMYRSSPVPVYRPRRGSLPATGR